ncbi:MAG TPA: glycoside hydrolase family 36 protein [Terriglobia bacterium]|nr:glycoside hydrolase family 36 protein [Terriglobia bacterium]
MKLLLAVLLTFAAMAGASSSYVRTGADGRSWTIGNERVERQLRFDGTSGLYTASWRNKTTATDFMKDAAARRRWGREFAFIADGKQYAGSGGSREGGFEFRSAGEADTAPAGKELRLLLESRDGRFRVTVHYAVYDGHPVVRKWIEITNLSDGRATLTHLIFEAANIAPAPPSDTQVAAFYGVEPRESFYTGRVDDAAITVRGSRRGENFIVMNEAPGYLKRTEIDPGWGGGVEVMYDTDLFPFERALAPRETFTSAKSSIAFCQDGAGMADPHWVMPSYTSEVLLKKGSAYRPPWIYNTWEPFERGINAGTVSQLLPIAGRMGLDVFTIDDGWQAEYGENAVNRQAFPGGLEKIERLAAQNNLRLGLWVPLAAISTNSEVYRRHPEWLAKDADGRPKFTRTASGESAVMCLATPYRNVAARRINDLIGRYHLKYVKIDLTTVFNAYGESPGCYAHGHEHASWAESLDRIYEGIEDVTASIYREHPDVLLDLTFELWGQKHLIDYGLLAAGDLDWLSNVDDSAPDSAGPRQARTLLYLRSLAIPGEAMLIGNLHADTPAVEERLATAMGSGPLFLGDLRKLTAARQSWYGAKIAWFKQLRDRVPINQGFFPLGNWQQPGAANWDGFARLSRTGEGMVAIFKNESGVERVRLNVPAFPDGSFHLRSVITGQALGDLTGAQFRRGIDVPLPASHRVEILEVSK